MEGGPVYDDHGSKGALWTGECGKSVSVSDLSIARARVNSNCSSTHRGVDRSLSQSTRILNRRWREHRTFEYEEGDVLARLGTWEYGL